MNNNMAVCNNQNPVHIHLFTHTEIQNRWLNAKSVLDKALAILALIIAAPVIVVAFLAVRLTSPGPVIYSQVRVGRGGVPFRMFKIRSMRHNCESISGPQWSQPGDPRVTLVGRFLRSTHLDELPQLINVIRGEMSLIGPRPERPSFVNQLEKVLPRYRERLLVPPGITGLAQIQLDPDSDISSVASKLTCDLHYVHNVNGWLDLAILVSTPLRIVGIPFEWLQGPLRLPATQTLQSVADQEASAEHATISAEHATANVW